MAAGVLRREPQAVEETDAKGMTYLHASIAASDPDTVKFLIKLGVNVNARVKDSTARTPLSMAVELGLEDVVRVLLASNADHGIPDRHSKWTVAHMAASLGFVGILDALMKFKADMSATDDQGSTVLHSAVRAGHAEVVRKLLGHPAVSAVAMNVDGETPLHTLARCPSESSAAILALLYPRLQGDVNPQDAKGNTPLFYAYSNGNASLCRGIVMNGGHLAMKNKQGRSCFDVRVPSLSLLHRLLGMLPGELPWIEGTNCQVCDTKFGVSTRKHHWCVPQAKRPSNKRPDRPCTLNNDPCTDPRPHNRMPGPCPLLPLQPALRANPLQKGLVQAGPDCQVRAGEARPRVRHLLLRADGAGVDGRGGHPGRRARFHARQGQGQGPRQRVGPTR